MSVNNARVLIEDAEHILRTSEGRNIYLKGVSNLTLSDLDSSIYYAESYIYNGGNSFGALMEPMGTLKELLDAYGLKDNYKGIF